MRFEHKFMSLIVLHSIAFYLFVLAVVRASQVMAFTGLFFFSVGVIICFPFIPERPDKEKTTVKVVTFGVLIYILIMILTSLGVSIMDKF